MNNLNIIPEIKLPIMLTIGQTANYFKERGNHNITEFRLRELAKSGEIVCLKAGDKFLINLEKFVEFLETSKGQKSNQENQPGKVLRIPVK